jgi:hypothetical protein
VLEREWRIKFPDDYKRVVMEHQGMTPTPYVIDIGRSNNAICELMTVSVDEQQRSYAMCHVYPLIKNLVPAGIYPFAGTGTGDYFCFDYRASATAPRWSSTSLTFSARKLSTRWRTASRTSSPSSTTSPD